MYLTLKRLLDIVLSGLAIVVVSPLLIIIGVILRFTGEREVRYMQERMGLNNSRFQVIKFATMLKNSVNMGTGSITLRKDPRVTRVGAVLRITKLNELPQLFNILRGDMSLVGPRPLMPRDFAHYPPDIQSQIYNCKPGLTGIGSVIFRDEQYLVSRSDMEPADFYLQHIIPYKGAVELWYQDHASLRTDFLIIFLTAWSVFFPKNNLVFRFFPSLPPRPDALDPRQYE